VAADGAPRVLGIVAGGGTLPLKIVAACEAAGRPYAVFAILGEADQPVRDIAKAVLPIGAFGKAIELLKTYACVDVVLAGKVGRPDFSAIKLDWGGVKLVPKLIAAGRHGDDALLKAVGAAFEAEGLKLLGVDQVADELLAGAGVLGAMPMSESARADMMKAIAVVAALGPFDVGQGAVVCEGLVLAVEAAEGTDAMLARCAALPQALRGTAAARRGVLVKMPKPLQEQRIDLPTVGVQTIEGAAEAGLSGIAFAAKTTLLLDRDAIIARADALGLFVYGFKKDGV